MRISTDQEEHLKAYLQQEIGFLKEYLSLFEPFLADLESGKTPTASQLQALLCYYHQKSTQMTVNIGFSEEDK